MWKIAGAVLIVAGGGLAGFRTALAYKNEIRELEQLTAALEYIKNDLQYRMISLPELCRNAGNTASGSVKQIFTILCDELESQLCPDVQCCMYAALKRTPHASDSLQKAWKYLEHSFGKFDVNEQVRALESVLTFCREEYTHLTNNRAVRSRNYQTLGLCIGAALAILLI